MMKLVQREQGEVFEGVVRNIPRGTARMYSSSYHLDGNVWQNKSQRHHSNNNSIQAGSSPNNTDLQLRETCFEIWPGKRLSRLSVL